MISTKAELTGIDHPAWLAECLDPLAATVALSRALCHSASHWCSLEVIETSLLRLKPNKRCLVAYNCRTSTGEALQVLGKVRFKGVDKSLRPITNHLQNNGIGDLGKVTETTAVVPRVWGEIAGWNMVLLEYVAGESAEPGAGAPGSEHARIADAVCDLHRVSCHGDRVHLVATELEILEKIYKQFSNDYPQWSARCWRIWHQLGKSASRLKLEEVDLIHRDFYFDQVLLLPTGKVAVLDLDLASSGPPGLDAGNYIAHLRELAIRRPMLRSACQGAEHAFSKQFLQRTEAVGDSQLNFWMLVALARLAALSVRFSDRLQTTEILFEVIEDGLS